jgi:hypothetical protein
MRWKPPTRRGRVLRPTSEIKGLAQRSPPPWSTSQIWLRSSGYVAGRTRAFPLTEAGDPRILGSGASTGNRAVEPACGRCRPSSRKERPVPMVHERPKLPSFAGRRRDGPLAPTQDLIRRLRVIITDQSVAHRRDVSSQRRAQLQSRGISSLDELNHPRTSRRNPRARAYRIRFQRSTGEVRALRD